MDSDSGSSSYSEDMDLRQNTGHQSWKELPSSRLLPGVKRKHSKRIGLDDAAVTVQYVGLGALDIENDHSLPRFATLSGLDTNKTPQTKEGASCASVPVVISEPRRRLQDPSVGFESICSTTDATFKTVGPDRV